MSIVCQHISILNNIDCAHKCPKPDQCLKRFEKSRNSFSFSLHSKKQKAKIGKVEHHKDE